MCVCVCVRVRQCVRSRARVCVYVCESQDTVPRHFLFFNIFSSVLQSSDSDDDAVLTSVQKVIGTFHSLRADVTELPFLETLVLLRQGENFSLTGIP